MSELKAIVEKMDKDAEQHGVLGQKWGVRRAINPSTGRVIGSKLKPRTSSEDQIKQDRIAKKLASGGHESLSNKDIQDFVARLNLEKQLSQAQAQAVPTETKSRIATFIKSQSNKQVGRFTDKAMDVAMEKAIENLGLHLAKKGSHPDLPDLLVKTSKRMAPKKK